jgi:hypothetical protein
MAHYRCYCLGRNDRIIALNELECEDDCRIDRHEIIPPAAHRCQDTKRAGAALSGT